MAEDTPRPKDPTTATNVKLNPDQTGTAVASAPSEPSEPESGFVPAADPDEGADLNSTMMSIDVSRLNMDATRTGIRIDQPGKPGETTGLIAEEEVTSKTWMQSLRDRFFRRADDPASPRQAKFLPEKWQPFADVWVSDPNASIASQILFYGVRAGLLIAFVWFEALFLREIRRSHAIGHPAFQTFAIAFGAQFVLALTTLIKRFSPGWLFALPASVLALVMAYGATSYHTADPLYFKIGAKPISLALNGFFLGILVYALVVSLAWVARSLVARVAFGILLGLSVIATYLNVTLGVPFEYGLLGPEWLAKLPQPYGLPAYVMLHGLIPALALVFAVHALPGKNQAQLKLSRGFARSLFVLFLSLSVLGLALMQKNRVFHALNFTVPKTLQVGGIENKILKQFVKIETANFSEYEGQDRKARYIFGLDKAPEKNKYILKLKDAFGFPVRYLAKSDLVVASDGHPIKNFGLTEEIDPRLEAGRYVLTLELTPRQPLVEWELEKTALKPTDQFVFKLSDPAKIRRFVVKSEEDILLDVASPKDATLALPLRYFRPGPHKLAVTAYDDLEQQIFADEVTVSVGLENDFAVLSPLPGDTVGANPGVLLLLKGINRDAVAGVTYLANGKEIASTRGLSHFHSLDLSSYPDGEVALSVKLKLSDRELTHDVTVRKKTAATTLEITEPGLGAFAERETRVAYRLSDPSLVPGAVRLWVNGTPVDDAPVSQDGAVILPISRWQDSEVYVALQADLGGEKVSDWVQLNRGLSDLALKFDLKSLSFLNLTRMAIVLDASVSSSDNWHGKSKWHNMKNVVLAPEVETRLRNYDPSFVVFGGSKPHYFDDCEDATLIDTGDEYNKADVKNGLDGIAPKGVSAIRKALVEAYAGEPEKIILFADSADSCAPHLIKATETIRKKSPATVITIVTLGRLVESDRNQLRELAELTGGRYYQPEDYEGLVKSLIDELSLKYELYAGDKKIYDSALDDKEFHLAPGAYRLVLPYRAGTKTYDIQLEHGMSVTLNIQGKQVGQDWDIEITPQEGAK